MGEAVEYPTLQQCAYKAYAEHQGWWDDHSNPILPWDEQVESVKLAWGAAVDEVLRLMGHS
jgi:hypothetical protein